MENDQIKNAFSKVKEDITFIGNEIINIKKDFLSLKTELSSLTNEIKDLKSLILLKNQSNLPSNPYPTDTPTVIPTYKPTNQHINSTYNRYPTDTPTVPQEIGGLKNQILGFSTGNEGVPTDRHIDQQTNQQTDKIPNNNDFKAYKPNLTHPLSGFNTDFNSKPIIIQQSNQQTDNTPNSETFKAYKPNLTNNNENPSIETNIKEASLILDSLDRLKKEIRHKFKQITSQEMVVFSTIYQLEEREPNKTTYKEIASILRLSESSIRDYVLKMIKKGIPIRKEKVNNRLVILSISPDLKKVATLSTIIQLREL
ncbi:MAG: hypothetical protein WC867_04705 [Candidatus Pacearchaeota archaeon]|jgi:DNA-binding MarR family transcriptional regulator